jgi:hypothetical protein
MKRVAEDLVALILLTMTCASIAAVLPILFLTYLGAHSGVGELVWGTRHVFLKCLAVAVSPLILTSSLWWLVVRLRPKTQP